MALIAQAGQRRVNDSSPSLSRRVFRRGRVERFDLQSQILRVILLRPADAAEIFRTSFSGQHAVNRRHGTVVEVGGGGPYADQRGGDGAGRIFIALFAGLAEPGLFVIVAELFGQLGQTKRVGADDLDRDHLVRIFPVRSVRAVANGAGLVEDLLTFGRLLLIDR